MDLTALKQQLPPKWRGEISRRTGVSTTTVHYVISGRFKNELVLSAAVKLAEEYRPEREAKEKEAKELAERIEKNKIAATNDCN